jgi:DNA-binding winged helix-turn-helix (wHTH) protein
MAGPLRNINRFGVYEVDTHTRELRKSGIKIKLHDQPFQVLAALLERPGEVITREELRLRIWAADTFVDFDHSLNTAVNKLRQVLGDSADNPRFIETVVRRGYRFIAGVQTAEGVPAPATPRARYRPRWVLGLSACLLLGLGGAATFRRARAPVVPLPNAVAITNDGMRKLGPLMCDRTQLYFSEARANRLIVAQVAIAGGETIRFNTPFPRTQIENLFPDHSGLLVFGWVPFSPRTLWRMALPVGRLEKLPFAADATAWRPPNGKEVAYARGSDVVLGITTK